MSYLVLQIQESSGEIYGPLIQEFENNDSVESMLTKVSSVLEQNKEKIVDMWMI